MPPGQDLSSVVAPPTIAFNPEPRATPAPLAGLPCPNCGGSEDKSLILTVDVRLPDNPAKRLRVLGCPACNAFFYDDQVPPDYAEPALNNRGRVPFYVQQGAGVSLITRPLAQLRRGPGAAYMEVGCGYGFGLDFALNTKGWSGVGIDPAPLAALGRDAFGLPIELRYLRDDDEARGTMDVVMGSEVIEHVPSPAAFVRTLRAMLRPGGVMVLTTPNGDDIDPATPPGVLIPLLSPSLHLVIQTRSSLSTLLHQAGFAHVEVDIDSHSLVAFASDAPLDLERNRPVLRRTLRSHLEQRARAVDPSTDLFLAFAGRAFAESVNDGDMAAADLAWALLEPAIAARFGLALDDATALPPALATCSLEEMAALVPLNLGGLLYARAIRRLADGTARAALEPMFLRSAEAAAAMRRALGELAMEDGQTEDIGWTSTAEAILCAADADDRSVLARLQALPPAPNGGARRRLAAALRVLVCLVNAGRLERGRALAEALAVEQAEFAQPGAPLSEAERDGLYALAMLAVQVGPDGRAMGDPTVAAQRFARVRASTEPGGGLWGAALRGELQAASLSDDPAGALALFDRVEREHPGLDVAALAVPGLVNLGRLGPARAIATRAGLFTRPDLQASSGPVQRDLLFSLAVLDSETGPDQQPVGNLHAARNRFGGVRAASEPGGGLWWASLRGEAQALGMMQDGDGIAALVDQVARDHPALDIAGWAVPTLLECGRTEDAHAMAARAGLGNAGFSDPSSTEPLSAEQRGVVLGLAALDARAGDLAQARGRFRRARLASAPGSGTWWTALRGEAQALTRSGLTAAMAALAGQVAQEHPEVDSARWALPSLVNAGDFPAAREVAARSGLATAAFAQPGATRPLTAEERDLVFALAVLDAEIGPDGRATGDAKLARGRFARVRRAAAEGSDLWWAALRGELQALDLLGQHPKAAALTRDIAAAYPQLTVPADILARIGAG